jgi:hypothetical protein
MSSCKSKVEVLSTCKPPGASLECTGTVSADVMIVAATVRKNLPPIVLLVKSQGRLFVDAANEVVANGKIVAQNVTRLGGKGLACATTAASADAASATSMNASVNASTSVSSACGGSTTL